jgi:hypothetical protein
MVQLLRLARKSASELGVGALIAGACANAVNAVRQAAAMQPSREILFNMIAPDWPLPFFHINNAFKLRGDL